MNNREFVDSELWLEVGTDLKPLLESKKYDHACSYLINRQIIQRLTTVFNILDTPFEQLMSNEQQLGYLVANRGIYDGLLIACHMWPMDEDVNTLLKLPESAGENKLAGWVHSVSTDMKAFTCWAVWQGADGVSVRKNCSKHAIKEINDLKKMGRVGDLLFISILFRGLVVLQILMDKAFTPRLNKLVSERLEREKAEWMATHTVFIEPEKPKDDGIRINSFADALATAKKGKKHATK